MGLVSTAYVKAFDSRVTHLAQQTYSRLRPTVMVDTLVGNEGYYEQLGPGALQQITSRHQPTPISDPNHIRRKVTTSPYGDGQLCDNIDKARTLISLESNYVQKQAAQVGRHIDQTLIDKMDATVYGGADGTSTFSPLAAMEIAADYGSTGTNSGLTIGKLRAARKVLDDWGADPMEQRYFVCTVQQRDDLLATTQVTSSDYNSVKALVQGDVDTFMGFKFVTFGTQSGRNAILPVSSSIRSCFGYTQSAMLLAIASEANTRITERADLRNIPQVYTELDVGATRLEEEKIAHVLCDES